MFEVIAYKSLTSTIDYFFPKIADYIIDYNYRTVEIKKNPNSAIKSMCGCFKFKGM